MLEQILTYLNNWFIVPGGVYQGTYTVENGGISLPFLQDGQYFRVMGSVFNDGLHRYGPEMEALQDETFTGTIWALAVPKGIVRLAGEIAAWQEKYQEVLASPYASESFGGYSYAKASGADGSGGWQSIFSAQLAPWRKIREYAATRNGGKFNG